MGDVRPRVTGPAPAPTNRAPPAGHSDAGALSIRPSYVRIAVAGDRRHDLVEHRELVVRERDLGRRDVLLEVRAALRARDRHDVVALREHPRERELAGVTPFSAASFSSWSTSSRFCAKFSPWKRGEYRRKSSGAKSSGS